MALAGQAEPTQVTQSHPYWSLDRREFVPAGDLRSGERVDTLTGETRVESVTISAYTGLVYNLETTEHVYRVDALGTQVHNSGKTPCIYTVAEQPRNALGQFMSKTNPGQASPGSTAVSDYIAHAESHGFEVLGKEVSVNTPFGRRT